MICHHSCFFCIFHSLFLHLQAYWHLLELPTNNLFLLRLRFCFPNIAPVYAFWIFPIHPPFLELIYISCILHLYVAINSYSNYILKREQNQTYSWEQRKFSDLVLIERGGSPRPIDDYITDLPDGLNWVKIGDAPSQGRYITKTAEKIKPEGLSKTRQVQPGDLILSNSMSFGKPYIMGINGCIHDGWLLIRDTQNRFDLKFLCHMLGTDQMLNQYRMFAAGSTVNNLNKELVGNTTVSLPSVGEQRVIGEYLESVDDLITLQQREHSE